METEQETLARIAQAVANGETVDWEAEERDHAGISGKLRRLRVIDEVAQAHLRPMGKSLKDDPGPRGGG